MTPAHIRFLMVLASAIRNGAVKTIKQAMAFAKQQFGKVDEDFTSKIINVFKKEGKTKKGDVVPIKKKEGTVLTEAEKDIADIQKSIDDLDAAEAAADADVAKDIVKKRTKDIAIGDPTGEGSEIMEGLGSLKNIKQGGKGLDPREGVVRAAAREILNKNKIKIGKEDPIDVLRKTFGEAGLDVSMLLETIY